MLVSILVSMSLVYMDSQGNIGFNCAHWLTHSLFSYSLLTLYKFETFPTYAENIFETFPSLPTIRPNSISRNSIQMHHIHSEFFQLVDSTQVRAPPSSASNLRNFDVWRAGGSHHVRPCHNFHNSSWLLIKVFEESLARTKVAKNGNKVAPKEIWEPNLPEQKIWSKSAQPDTLLHTLTTT